MDLLKKQFLLWQSQIEKKIPCHFCGAKLSEKIFSCEFGHDCCLSCKTQSCMACPNSNPFLRNHLSEFLISQFNNLKSCVEQLDISAINRKNDNKNSPKVNKATETNIERHNKMSMVTEKDINIFSGNKASAGTKPNVKSPANGSIEVSDGKLIIQANSDSSSENSYSCWIGTCNFRGIYEEILKHMKASHSSVFTSHELKGWPHIMNLHLNYTGPDSRQDYAFELQGTGLFVLHISVSPKENMKAHVLMFDSSKIAAQYGFNVEIKCDDQKKSFSAVVDSSRMPRRNLQDVTKGLFINENSLLLNTIKLRMNFKCLLEINTFNKSIFNGILDSSLRNSDLQKKPSNDQKPRFLNKPNFKPRRNFNHSKNKSSVPALLDLKVPNPPVTQPQVQPTPQPAVDSQQLMILFEQMMVNYTQKMTQGKIQTPQAQQSSVINSSSILQPSTAQTQDKNPQKIVEDQASAVKNPITVPTQSSQLQDLLIFDESNKSEDPALNKIQNLSPATETSTVDESEETKQEESDSKPNNDCKIN
ncbi:uncharacterized protein LOC123265812 [Cotesia glomerata]|uniref:Uncharacterized protein n=1 Tax=Cotesia glomerata TaxID=32391 RepID=A0AAV7IRS2_COTGL|nr:uncharacterized protein LOC123265812 [Cotesia glomerata]KAH0567468.1 hypothetical protein KQX54_010252 [Cotesia glomerata]